MINLVNRLVESDYIIALAKGGTILEQGTFYNLRSAGGYVQSLGIKDSDEHSDDDSSTESSYEEADRIQPEVEKADAEAIPPGDRTIFKYYFAAVGFTNLAIITGYVMIEGFIVTFRCKSSRC